MSRARPVTSPPPPGEVIVRAGALHPRAGRPAGVDRVAQRHVDERPERADVAHGREPGVKRRPRVPDAGHRLLGGDVVIVPGTPAYSMSPTRWLWQSMRPGTTRGRGRSRAGVVGRRGSSGPEDRLDAPVASTSTRAVVRAPRPRRRRAGARRGRRRVLGHRPILAARHYHAGMPTHRPTPVHRRRRGRPPPRQPTAGAAHRLRARPAGHRPEGVQRPGRAEAPDRPPRRRPDRGDGPPRRSRRSSGRRRPCIGSRATWPARPGAVRGDRRRLRQRREHGLDRGRGRRRPQALGCSGCRASAR